MSDIRDEANQPGWNAPQPPDTAAPSPDAPSGERAGFCQDCGTPLTPATAHRVGSAIFCEPCLTTRVGTTSPYTTVPPQAPTVPDEPSPALAAILGFIPGVGAMYNGQFAKGIVHLIIFAVLVSLCNLNGIFGLFIAGWIFYMVFEAFHTAVARRDGLPLPNAFGFNDIGERMGFGRAWSTTPASPRPATPPSQPPAPHPPSPPYTAPTPTYASTASVPVGTAPDWVGYVPPTAFTSSPPPDPAANIAAQIHAQALRDAAYRVPYAETYTGTPVTSYTPSDLPPGNASNRFPTGALWLIGLGVLILLGNLLPDWHLTERWWPPVLFAGLALWTLTRRLSSGTRPICVLRWPIMLMVIAVMLALHAAYFTITSALTAAVLLIVFGVLLLLERTLGAAPAYVPPYAAAAPPTFDSQAEARARTSWPTEATTPQPEAENTAEPRNEGPKDRP